jgi:hypothetical protein
MLVQPDAATACFRVKRTQDVDIHARNLASWDQHYEQTSPGAFQGEVRELLDHDLQVFEETASCATSQRCRPWQGGVWVGLAVPEHGSGLRFMGRPSQGLLGLLPWTRLSSAYGYAQATDEAWEDYLDATDRWFVDRDDFADALDFVGWYNHRSHKHLGIAKYDAYHLYLAYYTGPTGYRRGVWKNSGTIKGYATKVTNQAARYKRQLDGCA